MRTVRWHALVCSLAGAVLAAVSGSAWQLRTGAGEIGVLALAAVVVLGAATAGLFGGGVSLLYEFRLRQPHDRVTVPAAPAVRSRRQRLQARIGPDYRWQA